MEKNEKQKAKQFARTIREIRNTVVWKRTRDKTKTWAINGEEK